jgi:hypothetical protein
MYPLIEQIAFHFHAFTAQQCHTLILLYFAAELEIKDLLQVYLICIRISISQAIHLQPKKR